MSSSPTPPSKSTSLRKLSPAAALDLDRLEAWASARQASIEGGFNGRTGKLADGCYSFWLGSLFPLIQEARSYAAIAAAGSDDMEATVDLLPPAEKPTSAVEAIPEVARCVVPDIPQCMKSAAGVCGVPVPATPTDAWAEWSQDAPVLHRRDDHAEHVRCCTGLATRTLYTCSHAVPKCGLCLETP